MPRDFVWGVSTSSYQIEGAAAARRARPEHLGRLLPDPGRIANGDTGDRACDHYHRYAEDIALMRQIGVSAYRFSVSWPRVLPTGRGAANELGLAFYDRLVDGLLAAGIEPWLCLYHWDLPQALQDQGGWTNRDVVRWFADYAHLIARRLGDRVKRFVTFNEPSVFTLFGYSFGWHPPATDDPASLYAAIHHVNLAHGAAVDALRADRRRRSLGAAHTMQPSRPDHATPRPTGRRQRRSTNIWNRAFPDPQILGAYPSTLARKIEPFQATATWTASAGRSTGSASTIIRRYTREPIPRRPWASPRPIARRTCPDRRSDGRSIRPPSATPCSAPMTAIGLPIYVLENGSGAVREAR